MPKVKKPFPAPGNALRLRIDGLNLRASIGIYPHEHLEQQTIVLDICWSMARSALLAGDEIRYTVDYDAIVRATEGVLADRHFNLLETLVMSVEKKLLATFPIKNLHLSVSKPAAIPAARGVSVSNDGTQFF